MTDREKAIVMAYTGICMLTGDKSQIFHKYVEDIMGRPIWTHEMGSLADEIKEKSKADFIALCADESSSEKTEQIKKYCDNCKWKCCLVTFDNYDLWKVHCKHCHDKSNWMYKGEENK